ncbi:29450_t:CDS:2, partial [Racocetra persica]
MKWYIWIVDHPGNQVYRARPLCEFNIPYKKKDIEDIYQYLRARNNPYIIQDTEFVKILLDGCTITNLTPSNSLRDPSSNSSSTSSEEHIEEILSSFIEKNVEKLSGSENNWDMPENSDYELE